MRTLNESRLLGGVEEGYYYVFPVVAVARPCGWRKAVTEGDSKAVRERRLLPRRRLQY